MEDNKTVKVNRTSNGVNDINRNRTVKRVRDINRIKDADKNRGVRTVNDLKRVKDNAGAGEAKSVRPEGSVKHAGSVRPVAGIKPAGKTQSASKTPGVNRVKPENKAKSSAPVKDSKANGPKKLDDTNMPNNAEAPKKPRKNGKLTILARVGAVFGATVVAVLVLILSVLLIVNYGPSDRAHKLFVNSVRETSALKFLAGWFTTDEELAQILAENNLEKIDDVTNTDLIHIGGTPTPTESANASTEAPVTETPEDVEGMASDGRVYENLVSDEGGIIVVNVKGTTYTGRMMIVLDPSRVICGVCDGIGNANGYGLQLNKIIEKYDAIAGINAGGFIDEGGMGTGSLPQGYVFSQGVQYSTGSSSEAFVGFNKDNVLIVGYMSNSQLANYGIRDGVTFGPALIINGVSAERSGVSSGLNPRTAIGQREDGAVLLLTIDGRQANSLGASYGDMIDIFESFGAVNACNLDGGSSSLMIYKGEEISHKTHLISDRPLPTSFIVTK